MSLTKRDKERQLNELTYIVTGIRLFNKECGKGGEGIDDCEYTPPLPSGAVCSPFSLVTPIQLHPGISVLLPDSVHPSVHSFRPFISSIHPSTHPFFNPVIYPSVHTRPFPECLWARVGNGVSILKEFA